MSQDIFVARNPAFARRPASPLSKNSGEAVAITREEDVIGKQSFGVSDCAKKRYTLFRITRDITIVPAHDLIHN